MDTLSMTLIKKRKYNLKPFGRFLIKSQVGAKGKLNPGTIDFNTLRFDSERGMSYTPEQEKEFVKFMKKNKTDILTDEYGRDLYTRIGDNWVEVQHSKLTAYKQFLVELQLKDDEKSWQAFSNRMEQWSADSRRR